MTANSGPAPRDIAEVNRLGDELFAGAGFAGDEDGARRGSDPGDALEDLGHAGALTEQVVVCGLPLEPAAKVDDFVDQPAVLEGVIHENLEADGIEGLLNQVVSAQFDRFDGVFNGGEARHDDHCDRQVFLADLLEQVEAVDAREAQVGQHERARVLDQPFERGRAVGGETDLPVGKCEELRKLLADQLAVIHHEDASFHGAFIRVLADGLILVELPGKRCFSRGLDAG